MMLNIWRVPYSPDMARRFASSLVAVPRAFTGIARTRRLRAVLALPVAALSTLLTTILAWTVLINVLAYPFRPYLGLHSETRDIWASRYDHSWGGPTLAGAWATHAALVLLVGVPAFAWAVRGLGLAQTHLTSPRLTAPEEPGPTRPTRVPAGVHVRKARVTRTSLARQDDSGRQHPTNHHPDASTALPGSEVPRHHLTDVLPSDAGRHHLDRGRRRTRGLTRATMLVGAIGLSVGLSLLSNAVGIGDNILWLPHRPVDAVALAIAVAPLVGWTFAARTGGRRVDGSTR